MFKINNYLACVFINLGLFCLIGWSIYIAKSAWPLFGLMFIVTTKADNDNKENPSDVNKDGK